MPVDDAKIDHGQIEHLAVLAHELLSSLAAIDLAVDLLEAQAPYLGAVGQARTQIKRQLEQILRLTDDLLDVARIRTRKLALRKEHIDVASVIRMAMESLHPVIDAGIYTLTVQVPSRAVCVEADPMRRYPDTDT